MPLLGYQVQLLECRGPLTYDIELEDDRIVTNHVDNLRKQYPQPTSTSSPILHPTRRMIAFLYLLPALVVPLRHIPLTLQVYLYNVRLELHILPISTRSFMLRGGNMVT